MSEDKALRAGTDVIVTVEPSDLKSMDLADVFQSLWIKLNRNDMSVAKAIRILYEAMIETKHSFALERRGARGERRIPIFDETPDDDPAPQQGDLK